jgi:hypothetical protein
MQFLITTNCPSEKCLHPTKGLSLGEGFQWFNKNENSVSHTESGVLHFKAIFNKG